MLTYVLGWESSNPYPIFLYLISNVTAKTPDFRTKIKSLSCDSFIFMLKPKRNANGEWSRFQSEDSYYLYRSPNIVRVIKSRRLRWAGHVAIMEKDSSFKILRVTGTPAKKRPLGRPRR